MCGIAGVVDFSKSASADDLTMDATRMTASLRHRGPDDWGVWADAPGGVALGHTRLSILDLSAGGHQPMTSADGRHTIVFNGEIYNFPQLRRQLETSGALFRGSSDTEVLVEGIARWGVDRMLERCDGMFAFAVWDRQRGVLTLARDRLGEKPLYYGWVKGRFLFASELKALRAHPAFEAEIDRGALTLFMRRNCVPAPWSIYTGVTKLEPGMHLRVDSFRPHDRPRPEAYWSLLTSVERGLANPLPVDEVGAVDALDDLLRSSVASRMVADVPLGAFLSGGIDSSTVVALMQAHSSRPVRTFTIGFHESSYDEARHAAAVASHLGVDHTCLHVTPDEARAVIPSLPLVYDEPFADSSQIPTTLVSQLARRDVTVALSGDGGDELFGGYSRYLLFAGGSAVGRLPSGLRRALAWALTSAQASSWDRWLGWAQPLLPGPLRQGAVGDRLHKLADVLRVDSPDALYLRLISNWTDPVSAVRGGFEPGTPAAAATGSGVVSNPLDQVMYLDALTYLPDDILVKVDRASMARGLEVRVPFLDPRVVEFAWRLPQSMKIRDGAGKWLLRRVLHRYVPPELVERPKMGFGVPIGEWLRGPLRGWAEDLLCEVRLEDEQLLSPEPIRRIWREHVAGERDWRHALWNVLMFQAWWEAVRSERTVEPERWSTADAAA